MAGNLSVTIVEARQLRDEDTVGGENDAYVEVYLDEDYKQRTATVPNSNNPQWNETLQFRVEAKQKHLHVKVYDDDGPVDRDSVGSAKIDLTPVKTSGNFDGWVKLPRLFGLQSNGEIHIRLTFHA